MNHHMLNIQALANLGAPFAVLGVGRYALPVRFRVRAPAVECLVPTWSGVGDLLEAPGEVTLVAVGAGLRWCFVRGIAAVVEGPGWEGLPVPAPGRVSPDDLYQVLRIAPTRIELVDEARGWGYRETIDP